MKGVRTGVLRQSERLYTLWVPKLGSGEKKQHFMFFCYLLSPYEIHNHFV